MSINNPQKTFKLSSFYAAAFLSAKGLRLIGLNQETGSKKAYFVFEDSPERPALLESFDFAKTNDPEVLVDAREFANAIKTLKQILYQEHS